MEIFSGLPGHTKVIEHDIVTETNVKAWVKPYHNPEAHMRKMVSAKKWKMLELNIIENLQSE